MCPLQSGESTGVSESSIERLSDSIDHALEDISSGLHQLDDLPVETIGGSRLVDLAARVNAQQSRLEKILKPLKERIKSEALDTLSSALEPGQKIIQRGQTYQAIICKIKKIVLDGETVKQFLGAELWKFQKDQFETRIDFGVKE